MLKSLLFFLIAFASIFAQTVDAQHFVCPPCGNECDKLTFEKAGVCPSCKMDLVKHSETEKIEQPVKVGILLFEGVQIIDFTGPYEVFGQAGFEVFTVAETTPIKTNMGMKVTPDFDFKNCPKAHVFLIPGGDISKTRNSTENINWIKTSIINTEHVMSVCNGALILAETGMLDGLKATTFHKSLSELADSFPQTEVVYDKRFVDNGKIITTAGLTSGIDGALHLVEKLKGKAEAQQIALNLEYDWRPEENYARAALADKHLYKIFEGEGHPSIKSARLISTEGNKEKWKAVVELAANSNEEELAKVMEKMTAEKVSWKKEKSISKTKSSWSFTSPEGDTWRGTMDVSPQKEGAGLFGVTVEIAKK